MFSGGAMYRPGWRWLFKAYRSLNRRYKKNLKALYIVHPSTWPRIILGTMNAVISPKFGAKVHYIDNLSHLARVVPLNQINIPPAVYRHNLSFEDTITLPEDQQDHAKRVFGAPLDRLMGPNSELGLPVFIQECILNLTEHGLYVEGLFRRSPSSVMLKQVRAAYDRGNPVNLAEYDIHISAVLLKVFLREMPEPLFPVSLFSRLREGRIRSSSGDSKGDDNSSNHYQSMTTIEFIRKEVVGSLTQNHLVLMMEVFRLLKMVADRHESNKMNSHNLAVVITPNLVRHENVIQEIAFSAVSNREKDSVLEWPSEKSGANDDDGSQSGAPVLTLGTIVKLMIENYNSVF
ncbi:hypothetical protein EDD11_009294 [Mortierella claussenii]|nr:hypothetical protein EDD11_009294 [Mortierella claussenii]